MSADVIKEFLVSLGYKVDENGERKFVDGVKNVTKEVAAMGLAAAAAAAAVAAAVVKMADQLEELYFMSQRTGAAAENIKAIGYAASQMGSSVEGARGSVESLAKFLRENPGGEGLLASIGVQTRDVNGALRDTTDIMKDIGKRLSGMPQYRAISYANVFGIDYKTLMALERGVDKFSGRYKDMLRRFGLNVGEATKKSHDLMVSWRDMKEQAGILGTIVGTTLIGAFDELQHRWQSLDESQKANIKTGAEWIAGIVGGVALIMAGPVVWIAALAAGIVALWDDYQVWKEGGKSLIDWGKWEPGITSAIKAVKILGGVIADTFEKMESLSDKVFGGTKIGDKIGEGTARILGFFGNKEAQQAVDRMDHPGEKLPASMDPQASRSTPRGIRNNNPGNIIYGGFARRQGATGQDSAGFAIFPTAGMGQAAINANLSSYGNKGFDTPSLIAHRWSTTDQDAYTNRLSGLFGGDPDKKLNMSDPAVINALQNAIILQENGSNPYRAEMTSGAASNAANSSSSGIGIDQKVTINLHGVVNGQDAAKGTLDGMNGANDRLVRNLKPSAS
jgi:hypothetical protein